MGKLGWRLFLNIFDGVEREEKMLSSKRRKACPHPEEPNPPQNINHLSDGGVHIRIAGAGWCLNQWIFCNLPSDKNLSGSSIDKRMKNFEKYSLSLS